MVDREKFLHWVSSKNIEKRSLQQFRFFVKKSLINIEATRKVIDDFDEQFLVGRIDHIEMLLEKWPECEERYISVSISALYNKTYYIKSKEKKIFKNGKGRLVSIGTYRVRFHFTGDIDSEEFEW